MNYSRMAMKKQKMRNMKEAKNLKMTNEIFKLKVRLKV